MFVWLSFHAALYFSAQRALEDGGDKMVHFHFYSFTNEGVRAAIKKALEFLHLPIDGGGISSGNREIEIETKGIDETCHIGNDSIYVLWLQAFVI